jgi:DNA-binding transcriptional LysR family regulator
VVVTRLVEAGFDLAIRAVDTPEPGLIVRRLATSRIVVVATPGYLAAYGVPARPEDVARYRCVGFAPLAWRDRWRLGGREIAVRPQLLTHSPESLRAAALAGLGLVALPDWMVADLVAAGRVARVLPDCETPASNVYAVYPANRHIPPKVRAFVDHVARELRARGLPP